MATSALAKLGQRAAANPDNREVEIPLDKLVFDPYQPRTEINEDAVSELAGAMKANGQIHAITVQDNGDGTYTIVVGETRTRAATLNKWKTIRAKVRTDLNTGPKRLLFQLSENVNRTDLQPLDTARAILRLMEDVPGEQEGMTQSQIGELLGKSEGWVSRYVKFADEALQKRWVQTGILDTVEKVYRVSILTEEVKAEIERRVALPATDEDFLAKPLSRAAIDALAREAKVMKMAQRASEDDAGAAQSPSDVAHTLAGLAAEGQPGSGRGLDGGQTGPGEAAQRQGGDSGSVQGSSSVYQLPEDTRKKILQGAKNSGQPATPAGKGEGTTASAPAKAPQKPTPVPVTCKVDAENIAALIKLLAKSDKNLCKSAGAVSCSVTFPAHIAQLVANGLTGKTVKVADVPVVLHRELSKLR